MGADLWLSVDQSSVSRTPTRRLRRATKRDAPLTADLTAPAPEGRRPARRHSLELTLSRSSASVIFAGQLDLACVPDVTRLMQSLELLQVTVHIDLAMVSFLDSSGVEPLVEATRRRRDLQLPPLLVDRCSQSARLLLDAAGLDGDPYLNIDAWDRLQSAGARY
jgi:anti-anti-sigma regulatory factor